MFRSLSQIKAKEFAVLHDKLVVIEDNSVLLYENDNLVFRKKMQGDFTRTFRLNDGFLIRRDDNTSLILQKVNELYSLGSYLDDQPIDEVSESGEYILSTKYLSYYPIKLETKLIRTRDKTVIFTSSQPTHYKFIKGILLSTEKNLVIYDLSEKKVKSQAELVPFLTNFTRTDGTETEDNIQNYIGLFENVLWVGLSSGRLLAIDIENGSRKHQIGFNESDFPNFSFEIKEKDYLPFGELMQLDEDAGEIIGLRDKYLIKIDLGQLEPRRRYLDVGQSMIEHKISSSYRNDSFPIDEQFIYFCDDRQGKIGVLDRNKKEVVWSYELEMKRDGIGQILEMKYCNKRWYVLDRNETLHIFERIS